MDERVVDTANGQISSAGTYVTNERGEIVISGVTGTIVVTERTNPQGVRNRPKADESSFRAASRPLGRHIPYSPPRSYRICSSAHW
ncbi:MAG: hypothetical protein IJT94_17065 [Oscillibacter sp.]|nr:hypothetical protein [Oscillibacter sp.]